MGGIARTRCKWAGTQPAMIDYHDTEWGVVVKDSKALWGKLILDGFQAGLSWSTVLNKREAFYKAFHKFDPVRVARFGDKDIERLLGDAGIIRHRGKIESAISNAKAYLAMEKAGENFSEFCWSFTDGASVPGDGKSFPAQTPLSQEISKALKKRGFRFVGPTIVYAWMQAVGIVNDHSWHCFRRAELLS